MVIVGGESMDGAKLIGDVWIVKPVFRSQASVYGGRRWWLARRSVVVIELRSCSGAGQERETMRASQSVQYCCPAGAGAVALRRETVAWVLAECRLIWSSRIIA